MAMEEESHRAQMVTSPEYLLPDQGLWSFTRSDLAQNLKERNQYVREGVGKALM